MIEIRIYFEGNASLRLGFDDFFAELRIAARRAQSEIWFISAKDGTSGYRKAQRTHPGAWNILLKDSEEPVPSDVADLCKRHGIDPALVDRVFWMVQLMESWFVADPGALADYYGKGFSAKAIGSTEDVERIPKLDVLGRLKEATKQTAKREYSKVKHAPELLKRLDSGRVKKRAENCQKLFDAVIAKLVAARLGVSHP